MNKGKVYLVGAGPGDPGLMTVRGLELLRTAEVVIYDRLVNPHLLEEAPADAVRIYVGKNSEKHSLPQEEINELLIRYAQQGRLVVRLKGGDPFVFGRGGEEVDALNNMGILFEVVPGVSSAVAAPAYAGIPLTDRRYSSSFAVVTGHEDVGKRKSAVNWRRLAAAVDTIVVLMGVKTLPQIASKLISHGRSPATPVAVIRWGTTGDQETITGTLFDIASKAAFIKPPAVIVIGDVVKLRDRLRWIDELAAATNRLSPIDRDQPQNQP